MTGSKRIQRRSLYRERKPMTSREHQLASGCGVNRRSSVGRRSRSGRQRGRSVWGSSSTVRRERKQNRRSRRRGQLPLEPVRRPISADACPAARCCAVRFLSTGSARAVSPLLMMATLCPLAFFTSEPFFEPTPPTARLRPAPLCPRG